MELIARIGERIERVTIDRHVNNSHSFRVRVGERLHEVDARALGPFVQSLLVDGTSHETAVFRSGEGAWNVGWAGQTTRVELVDPLTHLAESAHSAAADTGKKVITAYMPGRVVLISVAEGAEVVAGQSLVVLEAMKMQNEIQADRAGTVLKILVVAGQAVEGGDPLVEIE